MLWRILPWLATGLLAAARVGGMAATAGISAISSIARGMLAKGPAEGEPSPVPGAPPTKEGKKETPYRPMDWILGKGPTGGPIDPAKISPLATGVGGDMDAQAILAALMGLDARVTSIFTIVAAQSNFLARIEALTRGVSGGARVEEETAGRLDEKKKAASRMSGFWKGLRKTAMKSLLPLAGLYLLASWIQGGKDDEDKNWLTKIGGKVLSMLTGGELGFMAGGGQYSGTGTIESFAGGGQAGGKALVGEKGPELVDYFGPGGQFITEGPTLISRAAHIKPLGGPNMGFGSGKMQMAAGGGMARLPTRQMSGYKGGGMTPLPARPMKAYASGGMFTDQARVGDSKFVVGQAKRRDRTAAEMKSVTTGFRNRKESIAGAMAGGKNPLQAGLAMEETGSDFASGFYAPRAIFGDTFRKSLGKKGIFPGSEMYISMQESKANTAIRQAGVDDYGNIDMGDTQFESPTPRQERDLFKQIMQGDLTMKPQQVEAYMAISPRIKSAVDAQMGAGNIPPALRFTGIGAGDSAWTTSNKLVSEGAQQFKERGEVGQLGGSTQKEYDRLKGEGYIFNKYGEWQRPAWGGYADMARGRSYSTTEGAYAVGESEQKIKLSTYGKYKGKEGRSSLGQLAAAAGPSQGYGQNLQMNPIAREKFDKFFDIDTMIIPAADAIVRIARQEVVTGMSVQNQRMRKKVRKKVQVNAPTVTNQQTVNYDTHLTLGDDGGVPDIPGSYGARAM